MWVNDTYAVNGPCIHLSSLLCEASLKFSPLEDVQSILHIEPSRELILQYGFSNRRILCFTPDHYHSWSPRPGLERPSGWNPLLHPTLAKGEAPCG